MSINTKEQLKVHIHKIHNLIRNSGAGYGLDALKIFNFFYGLKVLEPFWNEYNLVSAKFSQLVQMAKKANTDELELKIHDELFGNGLNKGTSKYKQGCLYELNENSKLRQIVVTKINEGLKTNFYKQIILSIDKIPTTNNKQSTDIIGDKFDVDIKGKTYEYFIGRDKQAISDLGSYFSDRHFTNFMIDIIKPELINGKVPGYIDPFGGSGGFTISFVNYIQSKYPKLKWNDNIDSINHYDMSEVVVKSCALEIFALTGQIPDMKEIFQIGNSFKADFGGLKYKYVFSNPPYGGSVGIDTNSSTYKLMDELKKRYWNKDNNKWTEDWVESQYKELKENFDNEIKEIKDQQVNYETCCRRIRDYCNEYDKSIDEKYRKEGPPNYKELIETFQITKKCNDKEACSLIMFMELLDKDGTAGIIIKEGVLFDSKYASIRKCLVDNFNITKIISISQDAFENTTTKTSIVIFKNSGKTEKICFSELEVEKESEDIFSVITNNKGESRLELTSYQNQIKKVSDKVKVNVTYDEISTPIIKSTSKTKQMWNYSLNYKDYLKDETYCPTGYKLVKLGEIGEINRGKRIESSLQIIDKKMEDNIYPVYGAGLIQGYTNIYNRDENKCILCRVGSVKSKNCCKLINSKFYISDAAFTFDIKNEFFNYKTYIYTYLYKNYDKIFTTRSSGSVQMTISAEVLKKIQIPIPNDITKLNPLLITLSKLHLKISDLTEQIPQKEKEICELISELVDNGEEEIDYNEYKLGEYLNIDNNIKKFETSHGKNKGKYNFHTGSEKNYLYCDEYNIDNGIIINKTNGSGICNLKFDNKFCAAKQTFILTGNNVKYVFYYLKNNIKLLEYGYDGACHKNLSSVYLNNLKIKILKDKVLIKHKLQDKFDLVDKMKEELETIKNTYQEEITKLMEPFKQDKIVDDNNSDKNLNENPDVKPDNNSNLKIIKSTKSKISKTKKQTDKEIVSNSIS